MRCRLDLGQVVYAINGFRDPSSGRTMIWAWLQENGRLKEDEYSYSGCLTVPRELFIRCAGTLCSAQAPRSGVRGVQHAPRLPCECRILPWDLQRLLRSAGWLPLAYKPAQPCQVISCRSHGACTSTLLMWRFPVGPQAVNGLRRLMRPACAGMGAWCNGRCLR